MLVPNELKIKALEFVHVVIEYRPTKTVSKIEVLFFQEKLRVDSKNFVN